MKYIIAALITFALFVPRIALAHDWDGDDGHGHKCRYHENDHDQLGLITVTSSPIRIPISYEQSPEHIVKGTVRCPEGTQPICGTYTVLPKNPKISYAFYAKVFNIGYEVDAGDYVGCHAYAFSRAIQPAWLTITAGCLTLK